jgi:hypothetical protein
MEILQLWPGGMSGFYSQEMGSFAHKYTGPSGIGPMLKVRKQDTRHAVENSSTQ